MAEKRARLAGLLVPRLTMTTVRRHCDALNRILKTAVERMDAVQRDPVPSCKRLDALIRERAPEDQLHIRVTKPKTRMPWAQERLQALLTSPIYTGCASRQRRRKPGRLVIRDATYWVPLMIMTMGTRIEEVLGLKRRNVILRNGVCCLLLGMDPDQRIKTDDSERVVPIPQLLLDLGFVEWVREAAGSDALLFPCAARRGAARAPRFRAPSASTFAICWASSASRISTRISTPSERPSRPSSPALTSPTVNRHPNVTPDRR